MQSCKEGGTLLQVVESNFQDTGFLLKASDGSCFDGVKFKTCSASSPSLVWGWGIGHGSKGDAFKVLFKWLAQESCLVRDGSAGTGLGGCGSTGSRWALSPDGQLSTDGNKFCVVRGLDNSAYVAKCAAGFEYLHMEVAGAAAARRGFEPGALGF